MTGLPLMEINSAIADRALRGEPLVEAELAELEAADVLSLGMLADEVRRARVGATVTFARVHDVKTGAPAEAPAAAAEVRLSGTPGSLDEALRLVRRVREAIAPRQALTGFSLVELAARARSGWGPLDTVLASLKGAGLDAVAEAPADRIDDEAALGAAVVESGLRVRALTVQSAQTLAPIHLLLRARLVAAALKTTVFSPLAREQAVDVPTTGYADVRLVALARLALPAVPVIQVDWRQYGPKLAQVALTFGASDLDRVSPLDDETLGRRRASVEDVRRNIAAAGFTAVERDALA
jgi:aminodeoxyfutalosine synthase